MKTNKDLTLRKLLEFNLKLLNKNPLIENLHFEVYYFLQEVFLIKKENIYINLDLNLYNLTENELKKLFKNKIDLMFTKEKLFNRDIFFKKSIRELKNKLKQRIDNLPIAYIFKKKYFYGNLFYVSKNVLIPREDSELIIESTLSSFLQQIQNNNIFQDIKILDICCGSGCLGLSLLIEILKYYKTKNTLQKTKIKLYLLDVSSKALNVAKKNAKKFNLNKYCNFIQTNILEQEKFKENKFLKNNIFDFILFNPPYIKTAEIQNLSLEVQKEPTLALNGGVNGLDFYCHIPKILTLKKNTKFNNFFIEIGYDQTNELISILKKNNISNYSIFKDLQEINRVIAI